MKEWYNNDITDEFIVPFVVTDEHGKPNGLIRDEDVCLMFNFRADRARQITRVLARNSGLARSRGSYPWEELDETIPRSEIPKQLHYVCMTQYDKNFSLPMMIPPESMENLLADILAQANLRNLRVAETEKYAHVTYFFNGGVEKPFPGEDRVLVPSQKVATYDLAPEMSARADCGRGGQGDRRSRVRRDGGELCQCRHGGTLGKTGADDQGGGDRRRVPGSDLSGAETARRRLCSSPRTTATPS